MNKTMFEQTNIGPVLTYGRLPCEGKGDPVVQMSIAVVKCDHQQSRSWRPGKEGLWQFQNTAKMFYYFTLV